MTTEAQSHIENEINKHTLSICNLRTRWNEMSPISRVPAEVLQSIFFYCACNYHERPELKVRGFPHWVGVSYVCRRWRNVALNYPALWAHHFVSSPRWTEELLARSRQAPLKISITPLAMKQNFFEPQGLLEKLMNHAERIQELHLNLYSMESSEVLSKFSSSTPNLQRLEIAWGYSHGDEMLTLSPLLFSKDTPALRSLGFSECPTPQWHSFQLAGLTTLSLSHILRTRRRSVGELLDVLCCMQSLTNLYLYRAVKSSTEDWHTASHHILQVNRKIKSVNLPRLSRLLIGAPFSAVAVFLTCVNVPVETEVRLEFQGELILHDDHTLLLSLLANRFSTLEGRTLHNPAVRSLIIHFETSTEVGVAFSALERDGGAFGVIPGKVNVAKTPASMPSCIFDKDWGLNVPLKLEVTARGLTKRSAHCLAYMICCDLPLTTVESIHIIRSSPLATFWWHILARLPRLRYLKLTEGRMPDLASILAAPDIECLLASDPGSGQRVLAPALEQLELHGVTFPSDGEVDGSDSTVDRPKLLTSLSRCAPEIQVTMTGCHVTDEH